MRILSALLGIVHFFILVSGCSTVKPLPPEYTSRSKTYISEPSFLSIPIEIPLRIIEEKLNQQFGAVIYDDNSYTRPTADDIKVKVYKNSPIKVSAFGDEILLTIPLKIWAQGRWTPCSFCPEIERQTVFDVEVFLKSKVSIQRNYQFKITTSSDGFEWKTIPRVSIGPINIPVSGLIEGVLDKQLQSITLEIDRNVNGSIDLKDQVAQVWNLSQNPLLLDDSTQTWLTIRPKALLLAPIVSTKTSMRITLGFESFMETNTGSTPVVTEKTKLPDLILAGKNNDEFTINVRSVLGFKEATAMAKSQMKGVRFSYKKRTVTVEDIAIYGKGELAYIKLLLDGSVKGNLYLYGLPRFNSKTNEFYFENLDYDINTRSVLIKAASWLLSSKLREQLQSQLKFSFDPEVMAIRQQLQAKLKYYTYQNLFTLRGTLNQFSVKDVYVAADHFDIVLNATGKALLVLEGIDF
jgi:hypothetical protein